ncbi:MAG TPA: hypothetical protein VGF48_18705 [Thermoanaerobaculia bacterium]|jgi:hypothetical protein
MAAAVEYEKVRTTHLQHQVRPFLGELLSVGFLSGVKQSARAQRTAHAIVDELQTGDPGDLSSALHHLSIANADAGNWNEVVTTLQQSIAADDARGDWLAATSKRIEAVSWRVEEEWRRTGEAPPEVVQEALQELQTAEERLNTMQTL